MGDNKTKWLTDLLEEYGEAAPAFRILLTPELAKRFLENMRDNRPPRARRVMEYRQSLRDDDWGYTGQPLIFNRQGKMMDGQHRCRAIIAENVSIEVLVVLDIEDEAFRFLDQGSMRNASDFLKGVGNAAAVAAALSILWSEEHGTLQSLSNHRLPPRQARAMLDRHPGIVDAAKRAGRMRALMSPSVAAYIFYKMYTHAPEKAEEFFEKLETGAGLDRGSPILLLRNRLLDNRSSKAKLPTVEILAICIKAWGYYLNESAPGILLWRRDSPMPEWPNGSRRAVAGAATEAGGSVRLPRRNEEQLQSGARAVVQLVRQSGNAGVSAEEIRAQMNLASNELPKLIETAMMNGEIIKTGSKRASRYYANPGYMNGMAE